MECKCVYSFFVIYSYCSGYISKNNDNSIGVQCVMLKIGRQPTRIAKVSIRKNIASCVLFKVSKFLRGGIKEVFMSFFAQDLKKRRFYKCSYKFKILNIIKGGDIFILVIYVPEQVKLFVQCTRYRFGYRCYIL